jgi:hypothetical protein
MFKTVVVVGALVGCATILSAQSIDPDTFKVNFFNTADGADNTVNVTNDGTSGGPVCADIYVFEPNQELSECCACLITPDGLATFSVLTDLTSSPLTGLGTAPTTGVIKILSGTPSSKGACPLPTAVSPTPGIRAWGTQIDTTSTITVTESEFSDATLSQAELTSLNKQCKAIGLIGSGHGVCACPPIS